MRFVQLREPRDPQASPDVRRDRSQAPHGQARLRQGSGQARPLHPAPGRDAGLRGEDCRPLHPALRLGSGGCHPQLQGRRPPQDRPQEQRPQALNRRHGHGPSSFGMMGFAH